MASKKLKQGEVDKIGQTSEDLSAFSVEGKKVVSSILTLRDGVPKTVLFGEKGEEIGTVITTPSDSAASNEK